MEDKFESNDNFIDNDIRTESSDAIDAALDLIPDEPEVVETPVVELPETPVVELPETPVEVTPETPVEVVPETTPEEPVKEDTPPVIDEEIASIKEPKNLSEANSSNWRTLQTKASEYKVKAAAEEARALELEAKLVEAQKASGAPPADYEELKKFRQTFDLKNDPEFRSKYEEPIKAAAETVYSILKKHGAADSVIEDIKSIGGPDKVSDEWLTNTLKQLGVTDGERMKKAIVESIDLQEKQQKEVEEIAANADAILKERETKTTEWYQKETKEIAEEVEVLTKDKPWARYRKAPEGATAAQIKEVEAHNAQVADYGVKFNSALWPQNAKERAAVAASAVYSHVLTKQLAQVETQRAVLDARVKALEKENSQLKVSGRLPKSNASSAPSKGASADERIHMNPEEAFELGMNEALG